MPDAAPSAAGTGGKPLSHTVLSGGKWLGLAALAQALLQIIIFAILARLLTPTDFGLVAVAGIFIDLATGMAGMGTSQALVQRRELTALHIRASFWISVMMGLLTTGLLCVLAPWLADILGSPLSAPLISALSVTFTIRAFGYVPEGLAARDRDFRVLALRQLVAYVIGYGVVGIVSAVLGAGAWSLVYSQIAAAAAAAALLIAARRFDWRPTSAWNAYREILGYGSGFSVARISNSLANQVDRAIVSMNTNPAAVGIYTRAAQVTRYPTTLVGQVIEDVLFPSFAGVQTDEDRLKRAYYRSVSSVFIVMTPVSVFFCISARPVSDLLLGRQWTAAVPLIVAFGVSIPFRSAQRMSSAILRAVGRSWLIAVLQLLLLAATAAGAVLGVRFGLLGVATAVTAAFLLHYISLAIACALVLSLDMRALFARHFAGFLLGILAAAGATIGVWLNGRMPAAIALLIAATITTALAFVSIWMFPRIALHGDGQWLVSMLLSRLPKNTRNNRVVSSFAKRVSP